MKFERISMEGNLVRLEPLGFQHRNGLLEAFSDGELWNLFFTFVPNPDEIDQFIADAEHIYQRAEGLAFAVIDKTTGKVAGTTRFKACDYGNKRMEIGYTFFGTTYQKCGFNTETRLLMLTHAFEHLQMNRIGVFIDYYNEESRKALIKQGAKEEGILRCHIVMPDGRLRDSVIYSFILHDWAGIKLNFMHRLSRHSKQAQLIALEQQTVS